MEVSQAIHDEAAYISESFGLPYVTALNVTLANAKKAAQAADKITSRTPNSSLVKTKKKSKKRVDR